MCSCEQTEQTAKVSAHVSARVCPASIFRPGKGQRSASEVQPTCVGGWKSNQVMKEEERNVNRRLHAVAMVTDPNTWPQRWSRNSSKLLPVR